MHFIEWTYSFRGKDAKFWYLQGISGNNKGLRSNAHMLKEAPSFEPPWFSLKSAFGAPQYHSDCAGVHMRGTDSQSPSVAALQRSISDPTRVFLQWPESSAPDFVVGKRLYRTVKLYITFPAYDTCAVLLPLPLSVRDCPEHHFLSASLPILGCDEDNTQWIRCASVVRHTNKWQNLACSGLCWLLV